MSNNQKPILITDLGMLYPKTTSKHKIRYGLYLCNCGVEFKAITRNINNGNTTSCGCYGLSRLTTHGMTNHPIYNVWHDMIRRTTNPNRKDYKNYGGRGITVCKKWMDISRFIEDMYPSFIEGLTIDRIDVNGNYEPSNCRWADATVQARNTRVLQSNNKSGYRGVYWEKVRKKWRAMIGLEWKQKDLGFFTCRLAAAYAYDNYVIINQLEHTKNFS